MTQQTAMRPRSPSAGCCSPRASPYATRAIWSMSCALALTVPGIPQSPQFFLKDSVLQPALPKEEQAARDADEQGCPVERAFEVLRQEGVEDRAAIDRSLAQLTKLLHDEPPACASWLQQEIPLRIADD